MKKCLIYISVCFMFCTVAVSAQEKIETLQVFGVAGLADKAVDWLGLKNGAVFSATDIRTAGRRLIARLQDRGYLNARIDSVRQTAGLQPGMVNLRWYVNLSELVRFGTISIEGDSLAKSVLAGRLGELSNQPFDKTELEVLINESGKDLVQAGYPFAVVRVKSLQMQISGQGPTIQVVLNATSGRQARIDKIILKGLSQTRPEVVLRELNLREGDVFIPRDVAGIPGILNRLKIFEDVQLPQLARLSDNRNALLIKIREGNATSFDGIIGYIPPPQTNKKQDGYFTGQIQMSFRNLFGTARKFEVFWRKPDQFSDEFRLYYEEPWLFDIPLNLGGGLERIVRDTTYVERSYLLQGSLRIGENWKAIFSVNQKTTIPDSLASRQLRLPRTVNWDGRIGVEYDTRDYPVNPRQGLLYRAAIAFGRKQNTGPSYLLREEALRKTEGLQRAEISSEWYAPLWGNQVFALKLTARQVRAGGANLPLTDHYWFGGAKTVRGYRENQFHGATVSWANLEYRFLVGRKARIFVFSDWGFFHYRENGYIRENTLPGYGAGIRFDTALGIMGVDFGLGRGDTFSTGKIHFGIENSF